MSEGLHGAIERQVLSWPGVTKTRDENGPGGLPVTGYRFGRRPFGHVHHAGEGGLADFSFPAEVREALIRAGRAIPHPAFPDSRTDASHELRSEEDACEIVELFRINYERARETAERRKAGREAGSEGAWR